MSGKAKANAAGAVADLTKRCPDCGGDLVYKFSLDDAGDGEQFSPTTIFQCADCKELAVIR